VVATPYLDEAERCHRIALMYEGQIQQIGTLSQLRDRLGLQRLEVRTAQIEAAERVLSGQFTPPTPPYQEGARACFQTYPFNSDPPQPPLKRGENLVKVPLFKGDLGGSQSLKTRPRGAKCRNISDSSSPLRKFATPSQRVRLSS
jgi:hypothetical protein